MNCTTCNQEYSPACDWQQGRCPHHPPLLNIQPKDTSQGHFYVSLAKSGVRVVAGVVLMFGNFWLAGVCIVLAEILGVIEEIV